MIERFRFRVAFAVLCGVALPLVLVPSALADKVPRDPGKPARDETTILVKFAQPAKSKEKVEEEGDEQAGETKTKTVIVRIKGGRSVEEKLAKYRARGDVVYAEPNYLAHALLDAPNDPSYSSQWGLAKIKALDGWAIYPGSYTFGGGTTIAVVDTGVEYTHSDLSGRVLVGSGANCVPGTCSGGGSSLDDNGHGTHVAGIAGAATNNGVGVAGLAFSSPIVPVKALDAKGSGTYAAIANGIIWAADHGARAVNLSLGGYAYSQTLCDAVSYAVSHGALVAAAAGNEGTTQPLYPAACPGAIGIAATSSTDGSPVWSNYGAPNVFVSAPGVSIYSTYTGNSYASLSGTSMATPFVTALSALLFGQQSSRTVADVKCVLASTADKVGGVTYGSDPYGTCSGTTWHSWYGYGRINAYRALSVASPPPPAAPDFAISATPSSASTGQGGSVAYTVSVTGQNGFSDTVSLSASGLPAGASPTFNPASVTGSGSSQLTVTTATSTPAGSYPLTITGTSGSTSHTASVTLVVNPPADFALSISPGSRSIKRGKSTAYVVSVTGLGGFSGAVTLSVTGLPANATPTFGQNPLAAGSSTTLRVRTYSSTPRGTYTLLVSGTAGSLTHTATATLIVK